MTISIIVLAAGQSQRYPTANKLTLPMGATTVIGRTLDVAFAAGLGEITVVSGADQSEVEAAVGGRHVRWIHHAGFERGMGSSIAAGVASVDACDGYLIWPGDLPFVQVDTVHRVANAFRSGTIVLPVCSGRTGHPVLFSSDYRDELAQLSQENGARTVVGTNASRRIEVLVDDPGIHQDIDTPSAYADALRRVAASARA